VYDSTLTPANIKKAFCKSGIYPLDKTKISDTRVAPATSFDKDQVTRDPALNDHITNDTAELFLLKSGGKVLENVTKHKTRNTLSKIVGGKCITEDDVLKKS
jgi:hypothetical protein